jgi:capsid protein
MLAFYEEAEVTAARWVRRSSASGSRAPTRTCPTTRRRRPLDAPPGSLVEAPLGYEFETFDPQHPNAVFKDFVNALLRGIARGLGVSYLTLTGDVSAANYSSMKAGLLPERDIWRALHGWLRAERAPRRLPQLARDGAADARAPCSTRASRPPTRT